jgi:hypothetical protein
MPDTITLTRSTETGYDIEPDGRIFVKTYTVLRDGDGNEVSRSVHRAPVEPDADVSKAPAEVKALATLVRTPERLARFEAAKPAPEPVTRTR